MKITIEPQYVRLTQSQGKFGTGEARYLHEVQRQFKENFDQLPKFNIITAPTGTGKSYAFPFPVVQSKTQPISIYRGNSKKGLIVLPTNALIDELHTNFSTTFEGVLSVAKLTSKSLDNQSVWSEEDDDSDIKDVAEWRGYKRWQRILEIAEDADLVITNPDILMYAMYGGYHQLLNHKRKNTNKAPKYSTGRNEFHNFLGLFDYVVIDEYHLYDEEQLANILMMSQFANTLLKENDFIKFFFVSATPEEGLKHFFEQTQLPYNELIEPIVADADHARAIHGALEVEFCANINNSIDTLIDSKLDEIQTQIAQGVRVLIILDNLRSVQYQATNGLAKKLPNVRIYTSTGYTDINDKKDAENLKNAQLILATNKAEVGVNYDVEYCIMQTGRYYQNFVQRFGRVSRGDKRGKIVVSLDDNLVFNRIKKQLNEQTTLQYYDFMNIMREALQGKDFYDKNIMPCLGAYSWVIWHQLRRYQEFNTSEAFRLGVQEQLLKQIPTTSWVYYTMNTIYYELKDVTGYNNLFKLKRWWYEFIDTYLHFRDSSMVVRIVDKWLDKEVDYSLEWILQHREILDIKSIEKGKKRKYTEYTYYVGEFKEERDKSLQYEVTTIPTLGTMESSFLSYKDVNTMGQLSRIFENAVKESEVMIKRGYGEEQEKLLKVLSEIRKLKSLFTRKRLTIKNIRIDDIFL